MHNPEYTFAFSTISTMTGDTRGLYPFGKSCSGDPMRSRGSSSHYSTSTYLQYDCRTSVQSKTNLAAIVVTTQGHCAGSIQGTEGHSNLDLLSAGFNHKYPVFESPVPDLEAKGLNSLSIFGLECGHIHTHPTSRPSP